MDISDDMDTHVISASNLHKEFGSFVAVDSIDVHVKKGEIYGFLGPNGAGKTTTIRMLTTLLSPTSGAIEIMGNKLPKGIEKARSVVGIVQQQMSLDKDLTVADNMFQHGIQHRMGFKEIRERSKILAESLGLMPYYKKKVNDLSGGWKRKTAIACSLVHRPDILFLDEPTTGLDTQSRYMLWDLIRYLNSTGMTIIITTHYIDEAESLCNGVSIIDKGKIIARGTPRELCDRMGTVAVEYNENEKKRSYRYFHDGDSAHAFVKGLQPGSNMIMRSTNLEDVFLELTGRIIFNNNEGNI